MSDSTETTKTTEAVKEYDNRNGGAVFTYSDKEMRGPFRLDDPEISHTAKLSKSEDGTVLNLILIDGDDTQVAAGALKKVSSVNPAAPVARGSITVAETGEHIRLVAFVKYNDDNDRYYQIIQDRFQPTKNIFIEL